MAHAACRPVLVTEPPRCRAAVSEFEETEAVVLALAQALEMRDRFTAGHCERLAVQSVSLGMALGLSRDELRALYRGGYVHDIGKVALPDSILLKEDTLTPEEWDAMRRHPAAGEAICGCLSAFEPVLPIIRSHHERWDGSGYPDGLRGSRIPLLARVLQLADIYDALTSFRPYKPAFSKQRALHIMREETDRGWRDPELMELFLRLHHDTGIERSLAELQRHLA